MRWRRRREEAGRKPWDLDPIVSRPADDPRSSSCVGVLVYRGVSSAEVDEPARALASRMHAAVALVGARVGPVHAVEPSRSVVVGFDPSTAPPIDVLVVPGGLGWKQVLDDEALRRWLADTARDARGILAISTGSLLLASVGRLDGRAATGHWLAEGELAALGANVSSTRTALDESGRIVTASGAMAALTVLDDLADGAQWSRWAPSPDDGGSDRDLLPDPPIDSVDEGWARPPTE